MRKKLLINRYLHFAYEQVSIKSRLNIILLNLIYVVDYYYSYENDENKQQYM